MNPIQDLLEYLKNKEDEKGMRQWWDESHKNGEWWDEYGYNEREPGDSGPKFRFYNQGVNPDVPGIHNPIWDGEKYLSESEMFQKQLQEVLRKKGMIGY